MAGSFRNSASFGKRQEFVAVAELLKRDFDVYMTLVDDQQIDCVVRLDAKRYLDIQIKARSRQAKSPGVFSALNVSPRKNLFFVFYDESLDTHWVIPSQDFKKKGLANIGKSGKNTGTFRLQLANHNKAGPKARPKFANYENNFDLLRKYAT